MTDRQDIFDRINEILENSDLSYEVKDIADLEGFLEDDENQLYDEYEEIEKLYTMLMEDSDFEEE